MGRLTGKTALVTGGSRGIGAAIARRLGDEGARVGVHYAGNAEAAAKIVAAIEEAGGAAFTVRADFTQPGAAEALWEEYDRNAEGVDVLVNNAGIALPKSIDQANEHEVRTLFEVNSMAPYFVSRHAIPRLRDYGRIINISSLAARVALPFELAYSMSKAPIEVLTRALAWDRTLADRHITVNAIAPGTVETDMWAYATPAMVRWATAHAADQEVAKPEHMAAVAAFLASEDSRYITGQVIDASGGTGLGPLAPEVLRTLTRTT